MNRINTISNYGQSGVKKAPPLLDIIKSAKIQDLLKNALDFLHQANSVVKNNSSIQHIMHEINALMNNKKTLFNLNNVIQ